MFVALHPICQSLICIPTARADCADEVAAIRAVALAYMQAWYSGDVERMKASLHPKLAKRSLMGVFGKPGLRYTSASDMIRYTQDVYGVSLRQQGQAIDVIVLDHYRSVASAKVISPHYHEYLHLAKIDGRWVIVNALYEKRLPTDKGGSR
ncbi:nuclear transport factor 2 family protein [uncultured Desulfosarcina sp.]|uniref:nuclear transport factor 2 family protein n=1 Tax=uncultured Desulfosarcina sp. TaxID=218289 RepID=UPI0029C708D4|nr:nuclear transport factor 2 family protein [uncultured Desulfosarcina sp.]